MSAPMKPGASQQGHHNLNHASSQGRTPSQFPAATPSFMAATPPAATPLASGATPRSGFKSTSPQTLRRPSPATTATLSGFLGTVPNTGGPVHFDSPSAAAVAMTSLGLGDLGALDAMTGTTPTGLSALGGPTGSIPAHKSDDDFAKKLDMVLGVTGKAKGKVSEEGIERLAKKLDFECMWEDTTHHGRNAKNLVIGGKTLALEIILDNHIIVSCKLTFPLSKPFVQKHMEASSSAILYDDLRLPLTQSPLTKTLDRFAVNFERLAVVDKLSHGEELDCHESYVMMYESLERLHRWDLARRSQDPSLAGRPEWSVERAVMCEEHGRPVLNACGRVGLSLQYWAERHLVPPSTPRHAKYCDKYERIWCMVVSLTPLNGALYSPIRLATDWISTTIAKADLLQPTTLLGGPQLSWLDPPYEPLTGQAVTHGASMLQPDGSITMGKYPNAAFKVLFDPPIIIPQGTSMLLHSTVHLNAPNLYPWPTYDALVFPLPLGSDHIPGAQRAVSLTRYARIMRPPSEPNPRGSRFECVVQEQSCTVYIIKGVYAQRLAEMSFAHPRQLVEMMPTLRQYAFLATLLEKSFGVPIVPTTERQELRARSAGETWLLHPGPSQEELSEQAKEQSNPPQTFLAIDAEPQQPSRLSSPQSSSDAPPASRPAYAKLIYDVTLHVYPAPRIQIGFAMPTGGESASITIEIRANGVPHITEQNVLPSIAPDGAQHPGVAARTTVNGKELSVDRLAKQLAICEHIGEFCEWIRSRLG